MSQEFRLMNLEEHAILRDEIQNTQDKKHNFIVVRDPGTNKILQIRKNLVVRSGREFILRKMFGMPYTSENVSQLNERVINLFGIGTGGTPVADPFNPISPTPADAELNSAVPFRIANTANPLPVGDVPKYADGRLVGADTSFFKKTFTDKVIVKDDINDDYYTKISLDINSLDARGHLISELALYTSRSPAANQYADFKIATRVTFQTEPLNDATGKGLAIEYYVYA